MNQAQPLWTFALALAAALLAAQAFCKDNYPTFVPIWEPFWKLKIVDTNNGFTILIAVLGFIAVRQQFVFGTRPLFTYTTNQAGTSSRALKGDASNFWVGTLSNEGAGPAIIRSVTYDLDIGNRQNAAPCDYQGVLTRLSAIGIEAHRDYDLTNYGVGAIIGPARSELFFEISVAAADRINRLDLEVRFRGRLGDSYTKKIQCIPRGGIPGKARRAGVPIAAPLS